MTDEKRPLLSFAPESADVLAKFQKLILEEAQRRIDESAEHLLAGIAEARTAARTAEIHVAISASKASLHLEALTDRIEKLERAVKRLEKPRSGISGIFKRGE